jgi:hypothetical protein
MQLVHRFLTAGLALAWTFSAPVFAQSLDKPLLKAGSYMQHPAGAVHYDGGGSEGAIVQIMGIGPSSTTFLFPQLGDFGAPRNLK